MFTLVTTFHQAGYDKYGKRMLDTVAQHFPEEVKLIAYYENMPKPEGHSDRWEFIDFNEACGDKQNAFATIAAPYEHAVLNEHRDPRPGRGQLTPGNRYLFEATRFAHKFYAMEHAERHNDSRYLVWCDADVVAIHDIPVSWLESLTEEGKLWSRVGRGSGIKVKYPECGFMIWDTQNEHNARYWQLMRWLYDEGVLFQLEEWHDSYVWWTAEQYVEQEVGHSINVDLGDGYGGHAFVKGRLGQYLDHLKGKRKDLGFSEERKWDEFDEETRRLKEQGIKV